MRFPSVPLLLSVTFAVLAATPAVPAAAQAAEASGRLAGSVRDAAGAPVAAACVSAQRDGSTSVAAQGQTDEGGGYSLSLPAGSYHLQVSPCATTSDVAGQWYPSASRRYAGSVVSVAGGEQRDVDVSLARGSRLTGRVVDDSGAPLADVCAQVNNFDWVTGGEVTDADGRFDIRNITAGEYRVRVFGCNGRTEQLVPAQYLPGTSDYNRATVFTLTAGSVQATPDLVIARPATVTGRVLKADGSALPQGCVAATTETGGGTSTLTGGDGSFSLQLTAGRYTFSARDCGTGDHLPQSLSGTTWGSTGSPLAVTSGALELPEVRLPQGALITGRIVGTSGLPVPQVCAFLSTAASGGTTGDGQPARSDADGQFRFGGIPSGSYLVHFAGCGQADVGSSWYGGSVGRTTAKAVSVTVGAPLNLDVVLPRAGSIAGTVRDLAGRPVAGACVRVPDVGSESVGSRNVSTDSEGRYLVTGLHPTNWRIGFAASCDQSATTTWYAGAETLASATPVEVGEGVRVDGIGGMIGRGGTFSGRITDTDGRPVRACVEVHDAFGQYTGRHAFSDGDGRYSVAGLRPAPYLVQFRPCTAGTGLLPGWHPGSAPRAAAAPVIVTDVPTTGIDAVLQRGAVLQGTVTDTAGTPLADVCVHPEPVGSTAEAATSARTDAAGHYRLDAVPTGRTVLRYATCSPAEYAPTYRPGTSSRAQAEVLTVLPGEQRTGLDVALLPGGSVSGRVTDTSGAPVKDVQVHVASVDGGNGTAVTDADGRYLLRGLPASSVTVEFSDVLQGRYAVEYGGGASFASEQTRYALGSGQDLTGIDAELDPAGSVSGTLRDQFGSRMPGVCVTLHARDGRVGPAWHTDAAGSYVVRGVRPGQWAARFSNCGGGLAAPQWWDRAEQLSQATLLEVAAGEDRGGVDASLTAVTVPAAPRAVAAAPADSTGALVTWQPPATDGLSPVIRYTVRDAAGSPVATASGAGRSARISGLRAGTSYRFTVEALNAKGTGARSALSSAVVPGQRPLLTLTTPASAAFGAGVPVRGMIRKPDGAALPGQLVDVLHRRRGTTAYTLSTTLRSDSAGRFSYVSSPGSSTEYALRFRGSNGWAPAQTAPRLTVLTLQVLRTLSRTSLPVGGSLTVAVTVRPARPGARVVVQQLTGTTWRSLSSAALSTRSTASITLRPAARGSLTYRVVAPAATVHGESRSASFSVRVS